MTSIPELMQDLHERITSAPSQINHRAIGPGIPARGNDMSQPPDYEKVSPEPHMLRVVKYRSDTGDHECQFDDPHSTVLSTVIVDLMVDGGFRGMAPESLVGKLVSVEYAYPYTYIAVEAKLLPDGGRLALTGATQ